MLFNNNNNNNAPANKKIPKGQLYSELRRILLHMRFRVFTTYVGTCATPFIQWRHCLNSENTFGIVSVPLIVSYLCTYIGCARLHWMFACVPNLSSREKVDNKSVLSIYDRLPQRTEHNGHTILLRQSPTTTPLPVDEGDGILVYEIPAGTQVQLAIKLCP